MTRNARQRDTVAQWAFDSQAVLRRFHLWLEDVDTRTLTGDRGDPGEVAAFTGPQLERALIVATAVTALGTRLFGRWGAGRELDKEGVNRVKKDADAISAYALSEGLWHLTRQLPENHAVMICLGEGLMPKAGETPEMGSNPLLGFGRVYARPQVARWVDRRIHRLLNEPGDSWSHFWSDTQAQGITVWGAAVDTLECTSRFAKGAPSGPMSVLHLFDQPLGVASPYEGYMGMLVLPREVVLRAQLDSRFLSYRTPRAQVLEEIRRTWPEVSPDRVHVWTLGGGSRTGRLGELWREWQAAGVHVVEDGWEFPGGGAVFTDSGTYAPTYRVGPFDDPEGRRHVFLVDGYAASAEAIQSASLDPVLGTVTSLSLFSSKFAAPHHREAGILELDAEASSFSDDLAAHLGQKIDKAAVEAYRESIRDARRAGMPIAKPFVTIDDFLPSKSWRTLSLSGFMLPDPYSGLEGIEEKGERTYRVTVRAGTRRGLRAVTLTLRLLETLEESRLVFSPLLDRFYARGGYRDRAVKISDSGRLRNEIQTLCLEACEFMGAEGLRVRFSKITDGMMPADKKALIREVLTWYKAHHPTWFRWLELAD